MSANANNYNLQTVECHCQISSRTPGFAKRTIMNLWWHFKAEFLSPAISACLWFDSRVRHSAFRKPGLRTFRLSYHFIVASQWDGNPALTVHAECYIAHAFRAAIKLTQCCYQGCAEGGWKRRRPRTSKAVGHLKSEILKSAFIKIL